MHQFTNCLSQFLDKQFVNLCSFKIDSHIFVPGNKTPKATYSVCTDTKYRGI